MFFFFLLFETIRQMICYNHPTEFTKSVRRRISCIFFFVSLLFRWNNIYKKMDVMAM
jgi:hypothetical protein